MKKTKCDISLFFLLFLFSILLISCHSWNGTVEKATNLNLDNTSYKSFLKSVINSKDYRRQMTFFEQHDLKNVEKNLLEMANIYCDSRRQRAIYFILLGLFQKDIKKKEARGNELLLIGKYYCDTKECNDYMKKMGFDFEPYNLNTDSDSFLTIKERSNHIQSLTKNEKWVSPLIEVCLNTQLYCKEAKKDIKKHISSKKEYFIIRKLKELKSQIKSLIKTKNEKRKKEETKIEPSAKIKTVDDNHLRTDSINNTLRKTPLLPVEEKKVSIPQQRIIDKLNFTEAILQNEKERYFDTHKILVRLFGLYAQDNKLFSQDYSIKVSRQSTDSIGFLLEIITKKKDENKIYKTIAAHNKTLQMYEFREGKQLKKYNTIIEVYLPECSKNMKSKIKNKFAKTYSKKIKFIYEKQRTNMFIKVNSKNLFQSDLVQWKATKIELEEQILTLNKQLKKLKGITH